MPESRFAPEVSGALAGRRLLDHPYYQAWQEGSLATADIGTYAGQYRHLERVLPEVLAAVAQALPHGQARHLVEANLDDELSNPRPHLELFEAFAAAVGAPSEAPAMTAASDLVALYRSAADTGPVEALSVIAAYETQAGDIASTKGASLRSHHALEASQTEFWDVHAGLEGSHASWTLEALDLIGADPTVVSDWASRSAAGWWAFLDEQDAIRSN